VSSEYADTNVTLGSSIINCTTMNHASPAQGANFFILNDKKNDSNLSTTLTFDAGTSTINLGVVYNGSGRFARFTPNGATFHIVNFIGDGTNPGALHYAGSALDPTPGVSGHYTTLTAQNGPMTITVSSTSETYPINAETLTFTGDCSQVITLTGPSEGLELSGAIARAGSGYAVGDTVTLDGEDVWTITAVDGGGAVTALELTTPSAELYSDGSTWDAINWAPHAGSGSNLRITLTTSIAQQYITSSAPTLDFVDATNMHALGTVPFTITHGTDSGNNSNLRFDPSLPACYAPTLISAMARTKQGTSAPDFIVAAQSAENEYGLFKKTTNYFFAMLQGPVMRYNSPFGVEQVRFNLSAPLAEGMELLAVLHFDGGTRQSAAKLISTDNYDEGITYIQLGPSNFNNGVRGAADYYFDIRSIGSVLAGVELPIEIDLDIDEDP
jgi:hypothetical protein